MDEVEIENRDSKSIEWDNNETEDRDYKSIERHMNESDSGTRRPSSVWKECDARKQSMPSSAFCEMVLEVDLSILKTFRQPSRL